MDYLRRNYKAIAGAVVGVLSVLVPTYVTQGVITPQDWGFAAAALIGGHQIVYATAANKVTVEAALNVLLPVLSKRSPYAAESVKAVINAVPEYVPTVVPDPPKPSPMPRDPAPMAPAPEPSTSGTYSDSPYVPPAGPITPAPMVEASSDPPVSEPVGATAVSATP